jgi:hypothetical protein
LRMGDIQIAFVNVGSYVKLVVLSIY